MSNVEPKRASFTSVQRDPRIGQLAMVIGGINATAARCAKPGRKSALTSQRTLSPHRPAGRQRNHYLAWQAVPHGSIRGVKDLLYTITNTRDTKREWVVVFDQDFATIFTDEFIAELFPRECFTPKKFMTEIILPY